jgi:hypothetical protein
MEHLVNHDRWPIRLVELLHDDDRQSVNLGNSPHERGEPPSNTCIVEETKTSHLPLADGLKRRTFPLRSSVMVTQFVLLTVQFSPGLNPPCPTSAVVLGVPVVDSGQAIEFPLEERRDEFLVWSHERCDQRFLGRRVFGGSREHGIDPAVEGFLTAQRRHEFHQAGKLVAKFFRHDPLGLAARARRCREVRQFATVLRLHLPVTLAQGIVLDLAEDRLDGLLVLGGIVLENARDGKLQFGGRNAAPR